MFGPDGVVGGGVEEAVEPDWRLLPQPKADTDDPGVGFLLGLADGEPAAVVATLAAALARRHGAGLARADPAAGPRPARGGRPGPAPTPRSTRLGRRPRLAGVVAPGPPRPGGGATAPDAVAWLDPVYTDLPGEVAVKLGLGLAYEAAGDLARAAELYDTASRTDPSYVSGAFGLARVRMAVGDREGAVEALARVPAASSMHVAARVAGVRALASPRGGRAGPRPPASSSGRR